MIYQLRLNDWINTLIYYINIYKISFVVAPLFDIPIWFWRHPWRCSSTRMISPHQTIESIDPYWHTLTCLVEWHHLNHVLLLPSVHREPFVISQRCVGWRWYNSTLFITLWKSCSMRLFHKYNLSTQYIF